MEHVVLRANDTYILRGLRLEDLESSARAQLEKLTVVEPVRGGLRISANRNHFVGRIRVADFVVSVPPPLSPRSFVAMLMFAETGTVEPIGDDVLPTEYGHGRPELFATSMAIMLAEQARRLLRGGVAREYVGRTSRLAFIRGRPLWRDQFGVHPASGIACTYSERDADNLLNRIVLAGLSTALAVVSDGQVMRLLRTTVSEWSQVASRRGVSYGEVLRAERALNRLTSRYAPAIALARAFLFGSRPEDLFAAGTSDYQGVVFYMPDLFEQFAARFISRALAEVPLEVRTKRRQYHVLLHENGEDYMPIIPDVVLLRSGTPIGILDAKYKSRYVEGASPNDYSVSRVSASDIYQLIVYRVSLARLHELRVPPLAALLAPRLSDGGNSSEVGARSIFWVGEDRGTRSETLRVLDFPLEQVLRALSTGVQVRDALRGAPELAAWLDEVCAISPDATSMQQD